MFRSTIHDLNSGFAIDLDSAADSRSPLRAVVLCVDFPNVPAPASEHPDIGFYYDLLVRDGLDVFRKISYNKLNLTVDCVSQWFTMPKNDADYGMDRVITYETHRNYIKDALDISCGTVDYTQYDILYIVPVHGSAVPYSPTMVAKDHPIPCGDGKTGMGLIVTFGADMYFRRGKLFAHENGHILGLPDLYTYEVTEGMSDCFGHIGAYDLMGLIEAIAPDYLGYSKWRLGWIDDSQVIRVNTGENGEYELTPVETENGTKLIVMPIDEYNGYILEYRAPIGLDEKLPEDGLLLYRINGTAGNGRGCITVIPPEREKLLKLSARQPDGLIRKDVSIRTEGIEIHSLGGGKVKIIR